jgi:hypothetical protein
MRRAGTGHLYAAHCSRDRRRGQLTLEDEEMKRGSIIKKIKAAPTSKSKARILRKIAKAPQR